MESAYHTASGMSYRGLKAKALQWLALLAFKHFDLKTAVDRYCEAVERVDGAHPFSWAPFVLLGDWK